jgi:hypothetical protein
MLRCYTYFCEIGACLSLNDSINNSSSPMTSFWAFCICDFEITLDLCCMLSFRVCTAELRGNRRPIALNV